MKTVAHIFTLSDYFWHLYRHLWSSHTNAQIAAENRPSLNCLPDDIVLLVLDQLEQLDAEKAFQAGFLTHELSDVVRFSTVSKRVRGLAEARILRTLHLGPSWSAKKLSRELRAIQRSESARRYTKVMKVDLWLEGSTSVSRDCPDLLRETIASLDHVRALAITATESSALALQSAFEASETRLEGITELTISPHMDWLIPKCPNLRALSTNDWVVMSHDGKTPATRLIEAVAGITDLQHFALHSTWQTDTLQEVLAALPRIRSLGMFSGNCTANLETRLSVLRRFQHLERLEMTDVSKLVGAQTWQQETLPFSRTGIYTDTITPVQAYVTEKVFKELPNLQELILGPAFRAWVVRRYEDGHVDLKWEATIVQPTIIEHRRFVCGTRWPEATTPIEEDELAEQWSLAETMNSRADVQTLADVMHHDIDEDEAEQLRLLRAEMAM